MLILRAQPSLHFGRYKKSPERLDIPPDGRVSRRGLICSLRGEIWSVARPDFRIQLQQKSFGTAQLS